MSKELEKGVALIITFFILTIILAIVLSISILLYNEIKIIRNIGNSVVAFYAADSGVEKVLYYDRKETPTGSARGICYICTASSGFLSCSAVGLDCAPPGKCTNCYILFSSEMNTGESYKSYNLDIVVSQQCKVSTGVINSYGFYKDASRAIRLDSRMKISNLSIPDSGATATAQGKTGLKMVISATVLDPEGVGIKSVVAAITGLGDEEGSNCIPVCANKPCCTYREINLTSGGGGSYSHPWNFGLQGVTYNINIMATDNNGNCIEVKNITITYE